MLLIHIFLLCFVLYSVNGQTGSKAGAGAKPSGTPTANPGPWWSNAVYYRILVDSFKDGNGDGLGDIRGAIKQISYVRAIGADAIILSPISSKSKDCSKPGVLDLVQIDDRYGDLDAFEALSAKASKLDIKLLITIPLHSMSVLSDWFVSSASKSVGFEDWFIWLDGQNDDPPAPETGVPAWVWNEERKSYLAVANNEATLNLCSETLASALAAAQCAWIRRGVSGLVLDPDFPKESTCGVNLMKKMAEEASNCARGAGFEKPIILVDTSLTSDISSKYYSTGGLISVMSRALTSPVRKSSPELALAFYDGLLNTPQDTVPTWMTSAVNESRTTTRYGGDMVDAINLLALALPGAVVIQQGDELATADSILEWASSTQTCWPTMMNPSASPFSWDDTSNAGFTSGEPWVPVAPNYRYANAKTEFKNDNSHLGVVRMAAALRKSPAMGAHVELKRLGEALAILRWGDMGSLIVVSNPTKQLTEVQLSLIPGVPQEMVVAVSSLGSSFASEAHVNLEKVLKLNSGETVLLVGAPRHCGGPGPVDKITNKLNEGWQKINKYFSNF